MRAAIAVILLTLIASIVTFVLVDVCEDRQQPDGSITSVCRHIEMTDPPVVALTITVVVVLATLLRFTEFSAFGVSIKQELREAKQAARSATSAAESATSAASAAEKVATLASQASESAEEAARHATAVANLAKDTAARAESSSAIAENLSLAPRAETASRAQVAEQVRNLAERYDALRRSRPASSRARTSEMTAIISKMMALLSGVGTESFDPDEALASSDLGSRVSGYAYLYANPDPLRTARLAEAVASEPPGHRFGQYWGLRALRKLVDADPRSLDLNTRRMLEALGEELKPTTDRAHELREILRVAPAKPGPE